MTPLDQLQSDRDKIAEILKTQCEVEPISSQKHNVPMDMLYQVYIDSLGDALKTLNSLIDYLKPS